MALLQLGIYFQHVFLLYQLTKFSALDRTPNNRRTYPRTDSTTQMIAHSWNARISHEMISFLTSALRYVNRDSVSLSNVTQHFPRIKVAGTVSTRRDKNNSRCLSWCLCFEDNSFSELFRPQGPLPLPLDSPSRPPKIDWDRSVPFEKFIGYRIDKGSNLADVYLPTWPMNWEDLVFEKST